MAFQVGDRIKCIGDTANTGHIGIIGREFTIRRIDGRSYYIDLPLPSDPDVTFFLYASDMVLIKPRSRIRNVANFPDWLMCKLHPLKEVTHDNGPHSR